jgi:hypothetical protein
LEFFDGFLHQANLLPANRHSADTAADFCTGLFERIRMRSHLGTPNVKWTGTGVVGVKARGSARVAHSHSGSYQEARCSCTGQGAIPSSHEEGLLLASKSDLQDIFALRVRKSVPDTGT